MLLLGLRQIRARNDPCRCEQSGMMARHWEAASTYPEPANHFVARLLADLLHLIGGGIVGSMPLSRTQQQTADLFQAAGAQESCRTHTPARLTSAQQSAAVVSAAEKLSSRHVLPRDLSNALAAAARRVPGVLFVATGDDVRADGLGDVPCMVPLVNRDGTPRHDTPRPVLALGKRRQVGQPVVLVVAETLTAARDAAEAIEVVYDPLPAITEVKDAIGPGAPQLFDHIPSNIVFDWDNDMGDAKATDAAFSRAARVATLELINNRVVVNSMEPRNAIADFDPATGRSTLYTATQGPHFVRDPLAEAVVKIPKEMLRLITPNVGGAFGMKAFVYPEQGLVVWAS